MTLQVNISLNKQYVETIVAFLVEQNIPFQLAYNQLASFSNTPLEEFHKPTTGGNEPSDKIVTKLEDTSKAHTSKTIENVVQKYMSRNFDKPIPKINEIAAEYGIGVLTLKKYFQSVFQKSFHQVYMEKRMEHAAALLKKGYKANEVTQMVGYGKGSAIKFNRMFQKHFGMTPKKYQMEYYGSLNSRLKKTARQQR